MATANIVLNCLVLFLSSIEAARILAVFPTPSISHQVVFRPLILELAKRGHELTVITTDPQIPKGKVFTNLTEIDLHDISYRLWRQKIVKTTTGKKDDLAVQVADILNMMSKLFKQQVETSEVQNLINNRNHFDLLLAETCFRPSLAFAHIFNIPAILVSSLGSVFNVNEIIGAPMHPILYPVVLRQRLQNLTLWEKINELYIQYRLERIIKNSENDENEALRMLFGKDFPSYTEMATKYVQMSFLNVHPIWENNRPVPPSVVYMGGIHQKPKNSLPEDLESYLNSSKSGVIYISFGTNVFPSMLPPERIRMMAQVFSELPYDVLWKYDKVELPGKSANIRLSKWLPQSDLLQHPKIKLFITQGGLQSTDEAITAGVPLIGMPMLGDQWYNVEQYVHHKIGVRLDMETLTKDKFKNAIQTVIEDKSYKNNIIKLRSIMYDQPQTSLERAVWWIEHLLRHGGAHLRSPAANITWTEYLELNLIAIILSSFILFSTLTIILLRYIFVFINKNYVAAIKIKRT